MIYAKIEEFNKNNFELLTEGKWFDRVDLYTLLNALDKYELWLNNREGLSNEKEIFIKMIKDKINDLILEDLRREK